MITGFFHVQMYASLSNFLQVLTFYNYISDFFQLMNNQHVIVAFQVAGVQLMTLNRKSEQQSYMHLAVN